MSRLFDDCWEFFFVTFRNGFWYSERMDYRAPRKIVERTLLLVLLALALFASPVMFAWAQDSSPWYAPYVLWSFVIAGSAWISSRRKDV